MAAEQQMTTSVACPTRPEEGITMIDKCYAVIMAGGRGQRFWPLSTSKRPKQILSFIGGKSLISLAVERLSNFIPTERIMIIAGEAHTAEIARNIPNIPRSNLIGEPVGRDTAAACALASAIVRAKDPDGAFCLLTADHIIGDTPLFQETLSECFRVAFSAESLITIGIQPTSPSTGFGYIQFGDPIEKGRGHIDFYRARRFVEKPDRERAESYLRDGHYCWNSGMFVWTVRTIQNALEQFCPNLFKMAERLTQSVDLPAFSEQLAHEYRRLDRISIDYAVMEKAKNIIMARGVFPWQDVGTWVAVADHLSRDAHGNAIMGPCEVLDSGENIIVSNTRLTALIGVKDLIVVHADGATLICAKDRAEDVKKMVDQLERCGQYRDIL